ncbi:MAG: HAMP domain-containing histidine kinase [Chloroflexi bacterium]|nr:HAMP domain-containing histidine kinase [Chloroflexota bacterium]
MENAPLPLGEPGGSPIQLAREIAAGLEQEDAPDALVRRLLAGAGRIGFARASLWLTDPIDPTRTVGAWQAPGGATAPPLAELAGGARLVFRRMPRGADPPVPMVIRADSPAAAAVAIRAYGELIGVLAVEPAAPGEPLDGPQVTALLLLAERVGPVLARARARYLLDDLLGRLPPRGAVRARRAVAALVQAEVERFKTEVIAMLSHELRTPLSLVYGYAELLEARLGELEPSVVRRMVDEIWSAALTLSHLLDDLLEFSRLERDDAAPPLRPVDLAPVLRQAAAAVRQIPGGERLALEIPGVLIARADPERMTQVLDSLLTNALRYAPEGPILLRAGGDADEVWIEVIDHGPGIQPAEQERVWERLYRGTSAARTPGLRGLGLGLALVRALVERQGGRVSLASQPGQGTTVRVVLPGGGARVSETLPAGG